MKFKEDTLGFRLILKPLDVMKMSAGGIDMSAVSERTQAINSDKGEILMIGPAAWGNIPVDQRPKLKVGDKVMYAKWGAKTMQDPENKELFYIVCNDEDILVGYSND
jgi:co-chaperonin GroES (HSP10)